jgi:hypothetical protein
VVIVNGCGGGAMMMMRADAVLQERQGREAEADEDAGGDSHEVASAHA